MKQSNSNSPRPEDFPIGSLESRAAARVYAEARRPAMIRFFDEGVLTHEYECEGCENDIDVRIIRIGHRQAQAN